MNTAQNSDSALTLKQFNTLPVEQQVIYLCHQANLPSSKVEMKDVICFVSQNRAFINTTKLPIQVINQINNFLIQKRRYETHKKEHRSTLCWDCCRASAGISSPCIKTLYCEDKKNLFLNEQIPLPPKARGFQTRLKWNGQHSEEIIKNQMGNTSSKPSGQILINSVCVYYCPFFQMDYTKPLQFTDIVALISFWGETQFGYTVSERSLRTRTKKYINQYNTVIFPQLKEYNQELKINFLRCHWFVFYILT